MFEGIFNLQEVKFSRLPNQETQENFGTQHHQGSFRRLMSSVILIVLSFILLRSSRIFRHPSPQPSNVRPRFNAKDTSFSVLADTSLPPTLSSPAEILREIFTPSLLPTIRERSPQDGEFHQETPLVADNNVKEQSGPLTRYWFKPELWGRTSPRDCHVMNLTLKQMPECNMETEQEWMLLITGTGRSGTKSTAECITQSTNRPFSHDSGQISMDALGACSWPQLFDNVGIGVSAHKRRFKNVWLQTREPLLSIPSRAALVQKIFPAKCCIDMEDHSKWKSITPNSKEALVFSLKYWVLWNSFASYISDEQFQVEKRTGKMLEEKFKEIMQSDFAELNANFSKCDEISHDSNSEHVSSHNATTWEELHTLSPDYTTMAKILAQKFGYDVEIDEEASFSCFLEWTDRWEGRDRWKCELFKS